MWSLGVAAQSWQCFWSHWEASRGACQTVLGTVRARSQQARAADEARPAACTLDLPHSLRQKVRQAQGGNSNKHTS